MTYHTGEGSLGRGPSVSPLHASSTSLASLKSSFTTTLVDKLLSSLSESLKRKKEIKIITYDSTGS